MKDSLITVTVVEVHNSHSHIAIEFTTGPRPKMCSTQSGKVYGKRINLMELACVQCDNAVIEGHPKSLAVHRICACFAYRTGEDPAFHM